MGTLLVINAVNFLLISNSKKKNTPILVSLKIRHTQKYASCIQMAWQSVAVWVLETTPNRPATCAGCSVWSSRTTPLSLQSFHCSLIPTHQCRDFPIATKQTQWGSRWHLWQNLVTASQISKSFFWVLQGLLCCNHTILDPGLWMTFDKAEKNLINSPSLLVLLWTSALTC